MIASMAARLRIGPADLIATARDHPAVFDALIDELRRRDDNQRREGLRSRLRKSVGR